MKKILKVLAMTALLFVGTLTTISANEIIEIDGQKDQKIEESIKFEDLSKEELLEILSEDEVTEEEITTSITDKEVIKEAIREANEEKRRDFRIPFLPLGIWTLQCFAFKIIIKGFRSDNPEMRTKGILLLMIITALGIYLL